jgi:hypothetical protein
MEMHRVRYFLAVAEHEKCNVAQPSLMRATKLLEDEFGGPLFHREGASTHLSEFGQMVRPHLQRIFEDSLVSAQPRDHSTPAPTRAIPIKIALPQGLHVAERRLHRRDEPAVAERLGKSSQWLRGFRAGFRRSVGRRRKEHGADAGALKYLDCRVDSVAGSREGDVHQRQLRPAIHRCPDAIVCGEDGIHDFVSGIE